MRGQKLGEHRAGAGVDAPPDGDRYKFSMSV